jgi:hypothetical protein
MTAGGCMLVRRQRPRGRLRVRSGACLVVTALAVSAAACGGAGAGAQFPFTYEVLERSVPDRAQLPFEKLYLLATDRATLERELYGTSGRHQDDRALLQAQVGFRVWLTSRYLEQWEYGKARAMLPTPAELARIGVPSRAVADRARWLRLCVALERDDAAEAMRAAEDPGPAAPPVDDAERGLREIELLQRRLFVQAARGGSVSDEVRRLRALVLTWNRRPDVQAGQRRSASFGAFVGNGTLAGCPVKRGPQTRGRYVFIRFMETEEGRRILLEYAVMTGFPLLAPGTMESEDAEDGWFAWTALRNLIGRDTLEPMTINPQYRRGQPVFFFGRVEDAKFDQAAGQMTLRLLEMDVETHTVATGTTTTVEPVERLARAEIQSRLLGPLWGDATGVITEISAVRRRHTTYARQVRWTPKRAVVEVTLPAFDPAVRRGNVYAVYATGLAERRDQAETVPRLELVGAWLVARPR